MICVAVVIVLKNLAVGRRLQVLHEHDACCFGAGSRPEATPPITGTRHAQILAYNRAVQAESKGWMCTAVTTGAPSSPPLLALSASVLPSFSVPPVFDFVCRKWLLGCVSKHWPATIGAGLTRCANRRRERARGEHA